MNIKDLMEKLIDYWTNNESDTTECFFKVLITHCSSCQILLLISFIFKSMINDINSKLVFLWRKKLICKIC
jgi:hypothetical protein